MEHETAGEPVSGCKWTRKTTLKIAQKLKRSGIRVSANTVGSLLKNINFSIRVNLDGFVKSPKTVMPDSIRHPEPVESKSKLGEGMRYRNFISISIGYKRF
ncbi:MAG: hypothetical protein K9N21_04415 [Deltaproteobacteria bacterium]|nr:hypothetical protein [Deltaproteobacteria bacterium]